MPPTADYHSRINRDLLKRIPPQAHYVGLEAAECAAEQARDVLDQVICADVESTDLPLADLPPLDCLIYGDVLEHLRDPWSCLQRQAPLLKPQGTLLASIPNVQHWSVILMLLRGEWPLAEEGLFDRTHLRWFTRSGITSMMRQAGLTIQEIQPRIFDPAQARAFVQALEPALPRLGLEAKTLLAGIAPLQYVIVATRS